MVGFGKARSKGRLTGCTTVKSASKQFVEEW